MLKFLKIIMLIFIAVVLTIVVFGIYSYVRIDFYHVTEDVANVRNESRYGLLLGTSKYLSKGVDNPFYTARIAAAARLYKAGVVKRIIVSGDNRDRYYDEPAMMRTDLVAAGVPSSAISADPMGLRTYDSVKRCREIFGVNDPIIISQDSHCKRALYIADGFGMHAVAFSATTPQEPKFWVYNESREILARIAAVLDVTIFKGRIKYWEFF